MTPAEILALNDWAERVRSSCVAALGEVKREELNDMAQAMFDAYSKYRGWKDRTVPPGTNIGQILVPLQQVIDKVLSFEGVPRQAWVMALAKGAGVRVTAVNGDRVVDIEDVDKLASPPEDDDPTVN